MPSPKESAQAAYRVSFIVQWPLGKQVHNLWQCGQAFCMPRFSLSVLPNGNAWPQNVHFALRDLLLYIIQLGSTSLLAHVTKSLSGAGTSKLYFSNFSASLSCFLTSLVDKISASNERISSIRADLLSIQVLPLNDIVDFSNKGTD